MPYCIMLGIYVKQMDGICIRVREECFANILISSSPLELVVQMCPKIEKMLFIYHKDTCPSLMPISGTNQDLSFVFHSFNFLFT